MQPFFQVSEVSEDVFLVLKNAFVPHLKDLSGFTPGFVEMDFFLCEDGSLCMNRISSSNADLYAYFRGKVTSLRIEHTLVKRRRSYNLKFSVA